MSKILITGAAGFIGAHLIKHFQRHHEIIALDRRRPDTLSESEIEWLEEDLSENLNFANLPGEVDALIHLAQSRFYRQFPDKAEDIFDVNVRGTFRLLDYARLAKAESFIFASTGSVYGCGPTKFLETDSVNPNNFYGISKLASEFLLRAYEPFFRCVIFRFFSVYGPGQKKMLIPALLEKVRNGETLSVEGESGLHINPIYVGDAIRAFDSALNQSVWGIFNIAGDEVVTIRDLIGLIEEAMGKKASIKRTNYQEPGDIVGDNTRMKELLNVYPETSLHEGLRKML